MFKQLRLRSKVVELATRIPKHLFSYGKMFPKILNVYHFVTVQDIEKFFRIQVVELVTRMNSLISIRITLQSFSSPAN